MDTYLGTHCPECGEHMVFCWDNYCLVCRCGAKIQLIVEQTKEVKRTPVRKKTKEILERQY